MAGARAPLRRRSARWPASIAAGAVALALPFASPAGAPSLAAQERIRPLRLAEAEALALRGAAEVRIAEEGGRSAAAGARAARAFRYPALELRTGWLRSDDPVAAFGTKLRQQRFGAADLALPTLNDPAPVTDWTAGAFLVWRGLDPPAWAEEQAAGREAEAAGWSAARVRAGALFTTRALYYRAVQAEARLRAAGAAEAAARATAERFRRRLEDGLLTRAELLQAEAELAAAEAGRVRATQRRDEARLELGLHLGWSADSVPAPADSLAPIDALPALPAQDADLERRSDLRALAAGTRAAEAASLGARLGWLPALEAWAGYQAHAETPFGSDGTEWNVGVGLRWTLFDGFRRGARIGAAEAALRTSRIRYEHAARSARVETRLARQAVRSTRAAMEASEAAARAAAEGRELMRRRFEEGLAGTTDLLTAEARAVEMEARAIDALADHHVARARLRFALESPEEGAAGTGAREGER